MSYPLFSLVVPCYNEEEAIPKFYEEALRVMNSFTKEDFEFVFVDDGSKDKTLQVLKDLSSKDIRVHYVSFSRNFGKESGLYAGLKKAQGQYVAVLDADLQDPPSLIPEMYDAIIKEGYDCAATRRTTRKNEPPIRSFFARLFYRIINKLSDVEIMDGARDFRLMTRQYVNSVLSLCERNRFTKGIFPWVGYKTKWFSYENIERVAGETKWNFWKLFLYSIDGILGFSTKPLATSAIAGVLALLISFCLIAFIIIRKLIYGDPVQGWASSICIMVFIAGIQLSSMGIIGLYISKIYTEIKQRPIYIAKEEN